VSGDPRAGLGDGVRPAEHDEDAAEAEGAVDEEGRDDRVEHTLEEACRPGHLKWIVFEPEAKALERGSRKHRPRRNTDKKRPIARLQEYPPH